jgi:hypothetical protein
MKEPEFEAEQPTQLGWQAKYYMFERVNEVKDVLGHKQ